jgi:hypothetical protein
MPSGSELPEVRPVFHLATDYFQGTFFVLRLRFPSKTSCDSHHIPFYTLSFNYLKNAQPLFSCRPYDSRPKLSLRLRLSGSHPVDPAFDGFFFRIPVWSPCGFLSEILRSVTFRILCGGACFKSGNKSIFQSKNTRSTLLLFRAHSCEERFPAKTFRDLRTIQSSTLCYNIEKNTQHFFGCPDRVGLLLAFLNSDPSVARIFRFVRFGFQLN